MNRVRDQMAHLDLAKETEQVSQYLDDIFQGIPEGYFRLCRFKAMKDSKYR